MPDGAGDGIDRTVLAVTRRQSERVTSEYIYYRESSCLLRDGQHPVERWACPVPVKENGNAGMNGDLLSALSSWWPLLLVAAWIVITRFSGQRAPLGLYRVIYHIGDTLNLQTKGLEGRAALTQDALTITGPSPIEVPIRELRSAELFRLHGLGRCIRISHDRGTVYLAVVRVVLFGGYFASINFFQTGKLARRLREAIAAEVLT
ncbi:hypothetical protein [Bradyrhizobium sp. USDA 10063]